MKSFIFGCFVGAMMMDLAFGLPMTRAISNSAMVKNIEANPPIHSIK
jgi:hypothetical protein